MVTEIYVPLRSQLSAIIFEKAMRRKNVKAASKSKGDGDDKSPAEQDDTAKPTKPTESSGGIRARARATMRLTMRRAKSPASR